MEIRNLHLLHLPNLIYVFCNSHSGPVTLEGGGACLPPPLTHTHTHTHTHFLAQQKEKRETKGKKKGFQKQNLLKDCDKGQIIIVFTILERLEFENFYFFKK